MTGTTAIPEVQREIGALLATYGQPDDRAAWLQVANTLLPFAVFWLLAIASLRLTFPLAYGLTLLYTIAASGCLLRVFGIQHDCGHNSFFRSKIANETLGLVCSVLTITPYHYWKRSHAYHHAHVSNLDYREMGYITIKTVAEYERMTTGARWRYRLYQNPFIMFGLGSTIKFLVLQRLTYHIPRDWLKERRNVRNTNLAIALLWAMMIAIVGVQSFLLVQLPIVVFTSAAGVWIFYIQHVYEDTSLQPSERWDYATACLESCSYYALPQVLEWCALYNNIHHIHHACSRVPNYRIAKCFAAHAELRNVRHISLRESFASCAHLGLWDAESQRLVRVAEVELRLRDRENK
ncbi:fatty acid desaturase family protein [Rubidibacter lacunae]|nr:fatty acid desaturase [Rubidibacter lacunae]